MIDREKVIKELECCTTLNHNGTKCANCEYANQFINGDCQIYLLRDALELLKAQEPTVMTWKELIAAALGCSPVYIEVKENEDKESCDDRWAMMTQFRDNITNGVIRAMSSYVTSEILFAEWYGKTWRCWTSKPTDEQRKAVKWND